MISYVLLRFVVFIFSLIPFKALYRISDFIAYILYKIVRYRYSVILTNLKNAFPEKSDEEIEQITKKSYLNLSDIIVESIKGMSADLSEIVRRYHFKNPEIADQVFENGLSAVGLVSHYNNLGMGRLCNCSSIKISDRRCF